MRAVPHPSITPSLTFILKKLTVELSGLIMNRSLTFGTGRLMNCIPGCCLAVSGSLQVALDN